MPKQIYVKRSTLNAPQADVFDWHLQPGAFETLLPDWEDVNIQAISGPISEIGTTVTLSLGILGPIRQQWISQITAFEPGHFFEDTQIQGPFAHWVHTHRVLPHPTLSSACILEDVIVYEPPLGLLGMWFATPIIRQKLYKLFDYRHAVMQKLFGKEDWPTPVPLGAVATAHNG